MDGLSAVSLAGNVAQFLEYGIRLVTTASDIAKSARGVSSEVSEMEAILSNLNHTLSAVKTDHADNRHDETLRKLVDNCLELSLQLTSIIRSLQLDSTGSRLPGQTLDFKTLRKAAQTLYRKGDMDQLSTRLFSLRSQISAHMIILIE